MSDIKNKVAEGKLISIDLEDYLPSTDFLVLDISQFLEEGLVLKEKDFRSSIQAYDFSMYKNKYVAVYCSTDALFPEWAYLLISKNLFPFTQHIFIGDILKAKQQALQQALETLDYSTFKEQYLVIKGCNQGLATKEHLNTFFLRAMPFAQSIMYGEACSSVPIYKKQKASDDH